MTPVKNQPATPLPWTVLTDADMLADHAYKVHASNAYPKLVEALREADVRDRVSRRIPNDFETEISTLLRELGERS